MRLFLVLLLTLSFHSYGQSYKSPNYERIKGNIENANSKYFYPRLLNRLQDLDTTLTGDEYRHLYYGYVFQEDYNPYKETSQHEELMEYYQLDSTSLDEDLKFIALAHESLKEFPLDMRLMNMLAYAYTMVDDKAQADKVSVIFQNLIRTLVSSGDGLSSESAVHVIAVSHEYIFLKMFGFVGVEQSFLPELSCDYIEVEENEYGVEGLYFNISQLQERNQAKMKKQRQQD